MKSLLCERRQRRRWRPIKNGYENDKQRDEATRWKESRLYVANKKEKKTHLPTTETIYSTVSIVKKRRETDGKRMSERLHRKTKRRLQRKEFDATRVQQQQRQVVKALTVASAAATEAPPNNDGFCHLLFTPTRTNTSREERAESRKEKEQDRPRHGIRYHSITHNDALNQCKRLIIQYTLETQSPCYETNERKLNLKHTLPFVLFVEHVFFWRTNGVEICTVFYASNRFKMLNGILASRYYFIRSPTHRKRKQTAKDAAWREHVSNGKTWIYAKRKKSNVKMVQPLSVLLFFHIR